MKNEIKKPTIYIFTKLASLLANVSLDPIFDDSIVVSNSTFKAIKNSLNSIEGVDQYEAENYGEGDVENNYFYFDFKQGENLEEEFNILVLENKPNDFNIQIQYNF